MIEVTLTEKMCGRCKTVRNASMFSRQKAGRGGLHLWCTPCMNAYHVEWRKKNRQKMREQYRRHDLKKTFGLTVEQYDQLLEDQRGVCAICLKPCPSGRRLAVDHDHETGEIRALLCTNCNRGLGCFQDDPNLMLQAIVYIERWKAVSPSPDG